MKDVAFHDRRELHEVSDISVITEIEDTPAAAQGQAYRCAVAGVLAA
jgi:hypothetical protein